MKPKSSRTELDLTGLSDAELDRLWEQSKMYRAMSTDYSIQDALSGDDAAAARSYLSWLRKHLRYRNPIDDAVSAYSVAALSRFFKGGVTLGEAFGVERGKQGIPTRAGAKRAIVGLIRFLHEEHQFPLSIDSSKPSAFLVAATLIGRYWQVTRSPTTLRDEYWNKRDKGENG
jgi:hypothetical protein